NHLLIAAKSGAPDGFGHVRTNGVKALVFEAADAPALADHNQLALAIFEDGTDYVLDAVSSPISDEPVARQAEHADALRADPQIAIAVIRGGEQWMAETRILQLREAPAGVFEYPAADYDANGAIFLRHHAGHRQCRYGRGIDEGRRACSR